MTRTGTVLLLLGVGGIVSWFAYSRYEQERIADERRRFEQRRVSTNDPLNNLAGCMANRTTDISQLIVARLIADSDSNRKLSQESLEAYYDVRNAAYEKCSPEHYQKVIGRYGTFTYQNLDAAFIQVMRQDPDVAHNVKWMLEVHNAVKSIYVK